MSHDNSAQLPTTHTSSIRIMFCIREMPSRDCFSAPPPVPHNRYHKTKLPTTHPQVLELCIVLGICLRGIALVLQPPTPITIPTQPHKYWNQICIIQIGLRIHI